MVESDFTTEASYTVIKGKLKATASSSFGIFIAFMDNVTKNVERFDVVCSHFSTLFENNINMPWSEMEELIQKMKWKGEYATNLTHDAQASLEDMFEQGTGRIVDVWSALKRGQLSKAAGYFEEYLMRPTGDKNIKIEIGIEVVTGSDIDRVKQQREQKANQDQLMVQTPAPQEASVENNAVILEVSLVLSPISGVTLSELHQGDRILVKITEQSNRGQYFIDLLNAQVENEIVPVPASIEKIIMAEKLNTVIVSIGPGIFGKAIEEDNVKVKRYDPAKDKREAVPNLQNAQNAMAMNASASSDTSGNDGDGEGNNKLIFLIIGGMALLMIIILIFLMVL